MMRKTVMSLCVLRQSTLTEIISRLIHGINSKTENSLK
nr:MAG TPA: hypothetical protein [Caudoviricetes sp.]